jgi:hypothetical protein
MRHDRTFTDLPPELVAEIKRRLALGRQDGACDLRLNAKGRLAHSIRSISSELHVSRDTIRAIDRGEYLSAQQTYDYCSCCGHRVLMPCRICAARAYKREPLAAAA